MESGCLKKLMTAGEMEVALDRIAREIVARHPVLTEAALVGIRRRGVPLAEVLRKKIEKMSGHSLSFGVLDITFYRDDLSLVATQPVVEGSYLDFDVSGKDVFLVDDVLFTGRTTRAALESVLAYGRPRRVELAVLVDRGRRELPIQADYVGLQVETSADEVVDVRVPSVDGEEGVYLTTEKLVRQSGSG
jgi:pyrimidine operon attenuation protein/uracil phosphoribosyltransferase